MENQIQQKSWPRRHPILTIIGILIVFIIIGSSTGKKSTLPENTVSQNSALTNKQYQEIFAFSGNGAKKSEPFLIEGERFKIKYDCKGASGATYCGAFVYKVDNPFPQAIMNSTQPVKDETIIYTNVAGKGEYYIDTNVLGSFTMTVEEYK